MAALPAPFTQHLLETDALPTDADVLEVLETLTIPDLRTIVAQAVDLLPTGAGARLVELGIRRSRIPAPIAAAQLRDDPGFRAILQGERTLSIDDCPFALTRICQRALQAIAGRVARAPTALALPRWGVDGIFGDEVAAAINGLREWLNTGSAPGVFGRPEAEAILMFLDLPKHAPPRLFWREAPTPDVNPGRGGALVAKIARTIAEATAERVSLRVDGRTYRYRADDFAVSPPDPPDKNLLRAPGGVAYGVREDRPFWKCNVFAGAVIGLADLPVPTFRVGSFRHYPRAERFGPALERKRGWKLVRHLDHRDPEDPTRALTGEAQDEEIRDVLMRALPGDLCFVDHPGEPGDDGGHSRVCVESVAADDRDGNVAPLWAQASHGGVILRRDGMDKFAGGRELQVWLLRYTG